LLRYIGGVVDWVGLVLDYSQCLGAPVLGALFSVRPVVWHLPHLE